MNFQARIWIMIARQDSLAMTYKITYDVSHAFMLCYILNQTTIQLF